MLIGVIFFNVLAWRILVKVSIGLLSVSINGFKNRDKKMKCYLNISHAGCYASEYEFYASMIIMNLS